MAGHPRADAGRSRRGRRAPEQRVFSPTSLAVGRPYLDHRAHRAPRASYSSKAGNRCRAGTRSPRRCETRGTVARHPRRTCSARAAPHSDGTPHSRGRAPRGISTRARPCRSGGRGSRSQRASYSIRAAASRRRLRSSTARARTCSPTPLPMPLRSCRSCRHPCPPRPMRPMRECVPERASPADASVKARGASGGTLYPEAGARRMRRGRRAAPASGDGRDCRAASAPTARGECGAGARSRPRLCGLLACSSRP